MSLIISDILKYSKSLDLLKEVEILLCDYLEIDSTKLFLVRDAELPSNIATLLQMNIDSMKDGYPLAYIRGKADFYGLEFIVNKNVLIPRRDTEILVEEVIACIKKLFERQGKVRVLELGVGSGCISISIANEFLGESTLKSKNCIKNCTTALRGTAESVPGHTFTHDLPYQLAILGIEKSREALEVARENVTKYSLEGMIKLRHGDLLQDIDDDFDILVANLPYVDESLELGPGVREHEPHSALFADEGGLALYRQTFEQLNEKKMKPRCILFEIGFDQGERAIEMCKNLMPDYEAKIVKDLEGRDRVIVMSY